MMTRATYRFISCYGVDLRAEHDTGEEGEEEAFKHSKQCEYEGQRTRHDPVTTVKVLTHAAEEEDGHHGQSKYGHQHDVQLDMEGKKLQGRHCNLGAVHYRAL